MLIDRALALIDDLSDAERLQLAQAAISAVRVGPVAGPAAATLDVRTEANVTHRGEAEAEQNATPGDTSKADGQISEETLDAMDRVIESFNVIDYDELK